MELENQGKIDEVARPTSSSEITVKPGMIMMSQGDAKLVLEQIRDTLQLQSNDPVVILETISKLEKVVKAVPRMENFITNISRQLS